MNKQTAKKLTVTLAILAVLTGLTIVSANGTGSPSPYHTPTDTGVNLDFTLVIGAVLYGSGVLLTSSSKAILAKLTPRLLG